jgi:CheY-like chemotaxis protein
MPNMTGSAAARAIRAMGYTGVILGVTGNVLIEDVNDFIASGAGSLKYSSKCLQANELKISCFIDRVLFKPVNYGSLIAVLEGILASRISNDIPLNNELSNSALENDEPDRIIV